MLTTRRRLLTGAAAGAAFAGLARYAAAAEDPYVSQLAGYGPLRPDPRGVFDLPEGFSYTVVSRAGEPMSDGLATPSKMDGMGCFGLGGDRVALVRNHELSPGEHGVGPFGRTRGRTEGPAASLAYDLDGDGRILAGGTSTLVYDLRRQTLERSHLSLVGTIKNCAGGVTPWGSWLTCEETVQSVGRDAQKSHGWVFEVPARAPGLVEPRPITGLGRFRHEAACVDPRTGVVYLTEDEFDGRGLFYRFLPQDRRNLHAGGRLQALGFRDQREDGDSRNWGRSDWRVGDWREAAWIDLDGADNPDADLRLRGHAKGAAWFARGEGIFFGEGELYFACTTGGARRLGQIIRYRPSPREGQADEGGQPGRLQLFVEPGDAKVLNMGDNLAVAPWGHLFVCEDKMGLGGVNYLRAVTPEGKVYTVGRQAMAGETDVGANAELAGVCFSPDGTTLFLNIYTPGLTLAVRGPWGRFRA